MPGSVVVSTTIHHDPGTGQDVVVPIDPVTGRGLLPITTHGHPVLMAQAPPVTDFGPELETLVEDMFATMYAAPGVGLAAPQVGVGLQVFVYDCGEDKLGHVCNPVCTPIAGELQDDDEGCLSVPGLYYPTARAMEATVTGQDLHGEPITVTGRGLLGRCLQHETDHLSGMLYLERLGGKIARQARREVAVSDWWGQHLRVLEPAQLPEEGTTRRRPPLSLMEGHVEPEDRDSE
jgi:peptide deformylase